MARSRAGRAAITVLLLLPLSTFLPASSAVATTAPTATATGATAATADDTVTATRKDFTLDGRPVRTPTTYSPPAGAARAQAATTPPVGTVRQWLGRDEVQGRLYRKDFTLRGVGDKIEVWVADDLAFPAGDCRNQLASSTEITDAHVTRLISEFDTNMFPKETSAFSTPSDRDGSNATLEPDADGNGGVYTGDGDNTVALVDNVRDVNYYTTPSAGYIAGFFSLEFNELFDRNVMTVDAFDWAHRTGADPPNEPTSSVCTSRPARPNLYEATFAHEWQHLLHYYTDPNEPAWVNEGLSNLAMALTGYEDTTRTVFDRGANSHLFCFQGFGTVRTPFNSPADCGGPENSVNLWGEGIPLAILADYGNAYSLLLFLRDRYGDGFISRLHRDGRRQGLASLTSALKSVGVTDLYQVLHDHQTMVLVDKVIGETAAGTIDGVPRNRVVTPSLRSTVNLANPQAYDDPGAAPNGADFVQLRDENGLPLLGSKVQSLSFTGAAKLAPIPLQWTTVDNDPDRSGNPVLWAGNTNNRDASAVTAVTVPTTDPTLRFLAKYGAEYLCDFGYVVVSTDGGQTYTAIAGDRTIGGPLGPGLNGKTTGFEPHSYDLSAYAGRSVLLGFRYVTDPGLNEGGLLVDDVTIGGTPVSDGSSLDRFDSITEIQPVEVRPANWNVRLIGFDENTASAVQLEFDGTSSVTVGPAALAKLARFPTVVAVVAYDDPTEQVRQYAPYTLRINGVLQPGG